jgi:hypothetical protein
MDKPDHDDAKCPLLNRDMVIAETARLECEFRFVRERQCPPPDQQHHYANSTILAAATVILNTVLNHRCGICRRHMLTYLQEQFPKFLHNAAKKADERDAAAAYLASPPQQLQ